MCDGTSKITLQDPAQELRAIHVVHGSSGVLWKIEMDEAKATGGVCVCVLVYVRVFGGRGV